MEKQPASQWELKSRTLLFENGPCFMGILNATPDSFSDGGENLSQPTAVERALRMEDEGAGIIDIGGESTRPYSQAVTEEEELRRVVPILEQLSGRLSIPISIDTTKVAVARAAIDLGAEIINDVSGLERDASMAQLAADTGVGICVMHMQGTPQTMQDNPWYSDVVTEVSDYFLRRLQSLQQMGIDRKKLCIDPGIGFGKTQEHNMSLLRNVREFLHSEFPVLIGHSRKGFIAKHLQTKPLDRDAGTIGVSLAMGMMGVQILRVHDVARNIQAWKMFSSLSEC